MKVSLIISTYNQPEWLRKVLIGYSVQDYKDFEIIIADDGSTAETELVLNELSKTRFTKPLHHVWHKHNGFNKNVILNKAIASAQGDYLIFTDGDCIPRRDFISAHVKEAESGYFLSAGTVRLPLDVSEKIDEDDIVTGRAFNIQWLLQNGFSNRVIKNLKLTAKGRWVSVLNAITPAKATWNGSNTSGWKDDILSVNGYDERMKYGGEDRELGERLKNKGIRSKQIRYSAICLHLDHKRDYVNNEALRNNLQIRKETKIQKAKWTNYGINEAKDNINIFSNVS
ncbi:MAG TPA: glycosyltransferase family 2 protein [Cyclobacteriaceae bacterium]|nr:glycosyltransferase family 2 protein [Cyclobacteriaceae bacterium]